MSTGYGKKRCDDPHDPDYGYCKSDGYTAEYYCNDGYDLWGGDRVRKCHDGYWGGKAPKCRKSGKLKTDN